ncbi:MAG: hypothetical protein JNK79_01720 [Chitinophagaceae bacterium]|nr:hypothetical protein [Chitinophagaceae bacterium]
MNLRQTILKEHSKSTTDKIVKWVGSSQARFDELMHLFLTDEYRVVQRAGWSLSYCVIAHPEFVKKYFREFFELLKDERAHPAVRRNILRLLPAVTIPKRFHGEVIDVCIRFASTPGEKAAAKAFSLHVLENMVKIYPEIAGEVIAIIQDQWDREAPSFRSRAKKFLHAVGK